MSGMSIWEILLLGVGLSMDAFAVSICKGLSVKKVSCVKRENRRRSSAFFRR